jgi:hypothetical protein
MWTLQFSNADAAVPGNLPNKWHVGLFNDTGSTQVLRCSSSAPDRSQSCRGGLAATGCLAREDGPAGWWRVRGNGGAGSGPRRYAALLVVDADVRDTFFVVECQQPHSFVVR